jgi:hypothetical protein
MDQFAHKPTTYRSHITCPVCGDQSTNVANGMIDGVKEAELKEKDLIKSACKYFEESAPYSYQKNVVKRLLPKLMSLVDHFAELGYPKPLESSDPVTNKVVNPILLHVARCEALRQHTLSTTGSDACPGPNPTLPLGPLEAISVVANHTLEKVLDIVMGRDEVDHVQQACGTCHEQLAEGTTVLTLCSCYTYGCQLCQRRAIKNYKNTYRESPMKCTMCNSRSVPIDNIAAAKTLEWTLLKQHPRYRSGIKTEELYCIYADIAEACHMQRAIDFHDFIEPSLAEAGIGSNNLHTKPMCLLEMARIEAERQRRDYFNVPVDQASDVSELPLGPLNRIHIRRNVVLEAFFTFLNGPTQNQQALTRADGSAAQVLDDPESLFDEVTNTVREKDGPGGELTAEVCRTVLREIQLEKRRSQAQEEARERGKAAVATPAAPARNLRLLLRNLWTPCTHPGCTVNPCCPVYLDQHIRTHHLEPVAESSTPAAAAMATRTTRRGRPRSDEVALLQAQSAVLHGSAGPGAEEAEDNFDEDDLSRAMAAGLATYRTEAETATSAAQRCSSQVPLLRMGNGQEDGSGSDAETAAQEGSKQAKKSKAHAAPHSRSPTALPLHTLLQGIPLEGGAATSPQSATSAGRKPRQRRRIEVEEDSSAEEEWDSAPARRSSTPTPDEDLGELWEPMPVPLPGARQVASAAGAVVVKSERDTTEEGATTTLTATGKLAPRVSTGSAASFTAQVPTSAASSAATASSSSTAAADATRRIQKRKLAYEEFASDEEAPRPATGRPQHAQKPRSGQQLREKQQGTRPSASTSAGFFTEFIGRPAAGLVPSVTTSAAAVPHTVVAEPQPPPGDTAAKTVAPVEAQMHALRRRREIMIQANNEHEQAERLGVLQGRPRRQTGDRAVRFAPHVDQFMFAQVDSESGDELLSSGEPEGEDGSSSYSQREEDISPPLLMHERPPPPAGPPPTPPSRPKAMDFFSIVDRHHVSSAAAPVPAPALPPVPEQRPPAPPIPPPPRKPLPLTPERQAVIDRMLMYPAESPMPAFTSDTSSESEDESAPPPQLPYLQLKQPALPGTAIAEADSGGPAQPRRIDNTTSQYAYPKAATEAGENREEYVRQSVVRYSQEAYRSEDQDRERASAARRYPRYGMPYMEDTRRFPEEVVRNPELVWRSGEAYLNLPNADTRRYELVFEQGQVDDRLPRQLSTRVEFWLKFPEGVLKSQPDAQPCSEKGFSRVKIPIETMRSELVAVLKLILLPKYGFRGKVAEVRMLCCRLTADCTVAHGWSSCSLYQGLTTDNASLLHTVDGQGS